MIEYNGFKVHKYKLTVAKIEDDKGKIFEIDIKKYLHKVDKTGFGRRIDYLKKVVDIMPNNIPKKIREYLVFLYIQNY